MPEFLEITVDKFTFKIAGDRLYSREGLWIKEEPDGHVRVGLSDFFQQHNGDVAFAEIPAAGSVLGADDEIAVIETIKVALGLPTPVPGTVVAGNERLELEPELINFDPYGEGWLVLVAPADWPATRAGLLTPAAYFERVQVEAEEELRK